MASLLLVRFFDETVAYLPYAAVESIRADVHLTYAQAGFLLFLYPGIGLLMTPFWAAGFAMVAYGLAVATRPLPPSSPPEEERSALGALLAVARDRRVIVAGLLVAVVVAFDDTFVGFAMAYLIGGHGLSPLVATIATGAGMAGGVVAAAWASRTTGRRVGLRTCALVLATGVSLLVVVPTAVASAVAQIGVTAPLVTGYLALVPVPTVSTVEPWVAAAHRGGPGVHVHGDTSVTC